MRTWLIHTLFIIFVGKDFPIPHLLRDCSVVRCMWIHCYSGCGLLTICCVLLLSRAEEPCPLPQEKNCTPYFLIQENTEAGDIRLKRVVCSWPAVFCCSPVSLLHISLSYSTLRASPHTAILLHGRFMIKSLDEWSPFSWFEITEITTTSYTRLFYIVLRRSCCKDACTVLLKFHERSFSYPTGLVLLSFCLCASNSSSEEWTNPPGTHSFPITPTAKLLDLRCYPGNRRLCKQVTTFCSMV